MKNIINNSGLQVQFDVDDLLDKPINYYLNSDEQNQSIRNLQFPQKQNNLNYKEEYLKLYLVNILLQQQVKEVNQKIKECNKSQENQQKKNKLYSIDIKKNKIKIIKKKMKCRQRRLAKEIQRFFICKVCNKSYGSENSLKQHRKIKHGISTQESTPSQE